MLQALIRAARAASFAALLVLSSSGAVLPQALAPAAAGAAVSDSAVPAAAGVAEPPPASPAEPSPAAKPAPGTEPNVSPEQALCTLIETAADAHGIPVGFFTRLLWKESNFRSDAVSPKGAQGIAQFMPYTAEERGLLDPFDPTTAIPASAKLLADLSARFGNLGLAAAAYNAGAQRVSDWLANSASGLPWETQDYVMSITGLAAETWAAPANPAAPPAMAGDGSDRCLELAALLKVRGPAASLGIPTAKGPWGVQVAGNFSRERALAVYSGLQKRFPGLLGGKAPMVLSGRMRGRGTRAFHVVRVPMQSRKEAEQFCAELKAAGGSCVVLKT